MADKIFIGKTFEDRWGNPEVTLTRDDLNKLAENMKDGKVKLVSKKSLKGTWYSEVNTFQPTPQNSGSQPKEETLPF